LKWDETRYTIMWGEEWFQVCAIMKDEITVHAYSGYKVFEKPCSFIHDQRQYRIAEILESTLVESIGSRERIHRFTVLCRNGKKYTLTYYPAVDQWFLEDGPETG